MKRKTRVSHGAAALLEGRFEQLPRKVMARTVFRFGLAMNSF
jgi:hypothetical protein